MIKKICEWVKDQLLLRKIKRDIIRRYGRKYYSKDVAHYHLQQYKVDQKYTYKGVGWW